ncbi:MAG: hypothetical protein AB9834_13775 [Lentimicrobium sp.]
MKRKIKLVLITLAMLLFVGLSVGVAQGPPPPPAEHGMSGNKEPGKGAPIGTGIALMTGLFAAYGAKRAWDARKKLEE